MPNLTGNRIESFRVEVLSSSEKLLGVLDGIQGGDITWNANADLKVGGSLTVTSSLMSWVSPRDRLRIWWTVRENTRVNGVIQEVDTEWPLGVFLVAAPSEQYTASHNTKELTLIDKLTIPKDDVLVNTVQVSAGSNIIQAAVTQLKATGETAIAATPSTKVLTNALTWPPGTSRLTVINDLLSVAGYWSLWTDETGQFMITPYQDPANRAVQWEFIEGSLAIHSPEWTRTVSTWDATNRVVLVSQADDNGNTWMAVATDDDPNSPTSTVSIGRVLNPIVQENVEASSQADLQLQANRMLLDNSRASTTLSVSHAAVPLWYNDAVLFQSQGYSAKAVILKMSLKLTPGSQVQAEWREV